MWQRYVFCTGCRIWRDGPLTRWKAYEPTSTNLLFLDSEPTLPERRLGRHVVMRIASLRPGFEGIPDVLSGYCNLVRGLQPGAITRLGRGDGAAAGRLPRSASLCPEQVFLLEGGASGPSRVVYVRHPDAVARRALYARQSAVAGRWRASQTSASPTAAVSPPTTGTAA